MPHVVLTRKNRPDLNAKDERAVNFIIDALCRRWHKHQIKTELRRRFGYHHYKQHSALISAARRRMRLQVKKDVAKHIDESINFYRLIIRSDSATVKDKLQAQERLDRMLGLEGRGDLRNPEPELPSKVG